MLIQTLLKTSGNLVKNPGFEDGLEHWILAGVNTGNNDPAEGTQVAILGPGVASISQDVELCLWRRQPLLLSFIAYAANDSVGFGNLAAQVLWLDGSGNTLGTGFASFQSSRVFSDNSRITFYGVTDTPPLGTVGARLIISKGEGGNAPDLIALDQVILTPIKSSNLIQNPGFEAGLNFWNATGFLPDFLNPFEGSANALAQAGGTLYQDIPIALLPWRSSFLLSFAVQGAAGSSLHVRLEWLNAANNIIGTPGLELSISGTTLNQQVGYLTYLNLSEPSPPGVVRARLLFTGNDVRIDQVVLTLTETKNLVLNPSFVSLDHWTAIGTVPQVIPTPYEGNTVATINQGGGVLFQDVLLPFAAGRCFLLHFGLEYSGGRFPNGNIVVKVIWLNGFGREIGLGLNLGIPLFIFLRSEWLVYAGITEAAPLLAAGARIQFTKSAGGTGGAVDVDHVVFGRLI